MHKYLCCFSLAVVAVCTSSVLAQSYDFSLDEKASGIVQTSSVMLPFAGTLRGNYDEETNPEGTRTHVGLFGGGPNDDISFEATFGLTGSNESTPSGSFALEVDPDFLVATLSGFELDVLGGGSDSIEATLYVLYQTFRTYSPDSLYIGGIELPIPLGEVEIQSLTMVQSIDVPLVIVPGEGDEPATIAGVVPVDITFQVAILGQEIGGIPLPMMLPVAGTFIENDNGARIEIEAAFEFDEPLPSTGIPLENVPLQLPTLLPPGNFASVLLNGTDSQGSIAGSWDLFLVADADSATCADDPDINGDGAVDGADLTIVLAYWDAPGGPADVNCDGIVNGEDLTIVLGNWGS